MPNIRELVESDLGQTLEGEYGLPVELVDPDGNEYSLNAQVIYHRQKFNPDTGETITVNEMVVTLRRSSMSRVPEPGENWLLRAPKDPSTTATLENFIITPTRSVEGDRSIGFIRLYPQKATQS